MMGKKVSVIVPVYNTERYLPRCLDSVLSQTLKEIEVIVVIDASPDDSRGVAREYQKQDDRIKVVEKEINEGLAAARNSGVAVASGEYIIHLDSDDEIVRGILVCKDGKILHEGALSAMGEGK